MAATVKTLIEHSGELYWGTRQAMPGYHFGVSLNVMENGLVARVVYVMSDLGDFAAVNEVYARSFGAHLPARSAVQVARLTMGALVEVEVVAEVSAA